jgi:hypothetical protein
MDQFATERRRALLRQVRTILGHLQSFPKDFQPAPDPKIVWSPDDSVDKQKATIEYIFRQHFAQWPREVLSNFMALTFLVGNECALAREDYPHLDGLFVQKPRMTEADHSIQLHSYMFGMGALRQIFHSDPQFRAKRR